MQATVEKQRDATTRRVLPPHLRRLEAEAIEILRGQLTALHSRKLRSFDEPPFR